ncbi:MAG: hypothetical protein WCF23_01865 [Candidatus Nitrosopolaris sp.]
MTANGHDIIKAYSDLAGISIYYDCFGRADLLIAKTQRTKAVS